MIGTFLLLAIGFFVIGLFFDRIVSHCNQLADSTIAWGAIYLAMALACSVIWWYGTLTGMWGEWAGW